MKSLLEEVHRVTQLIIEEATHGGSIKPESKAALEKLVHALEASEHSRLQRQIALTAGSRVPKDFTQNDADYLEYVIALTGRAIERHISSREMDRLLRKRYAQLCDKEVEVEEQKN